MVRETIVILDNNGDGYSLPARRVLCPRCNGDGKVGHPAFSDGITAEEWATEWDDFERDMYLGGSYDIKCPECEGRRWVLGLDESQCSEEEVQMHRDYHDELYAVDREREAERRFGC
jgi:RecJ-like exonuclease